MKLFFKKLEEQNNLFKIVSIKEKEFEFIKKEFLDFLNKNKTKKIKILEIGGGIGSFCFRFSYFLIKKGFDIFYVIVEKDKEKIKVLKENLKEFLEIIDKEKFDLKIVCEDAKDFLLKNKENFDFVLIDANKKQYNFYFEKTLNITKFLVIDDIFLIKNTKKFEPIKKELIKLYQKIKNLEKQNKIKTKELREKNSGLILIVHKN